MRTGRVAAEAGIGGDGIALGWPRRSPEADYCGRFIPWSLVQDADPEATPPELRLTDGRTVFIASAHRERLATALAEAGVAVRRRPDVWQDLLEPFPDTEYDDASRTRCEGRLHDWGFTDREIRDIRRRVRLRMLAETMVSWEWLQDPVVESRYCVVRSNARIWNRPTGRSANRQTVPCRAAPTRRRGNPRTS